LHPKFWAAEDPCWAVFGFLDAAAEGTNAGDFVGLAGPSFEPEAPFAKAAGSGNRLLMPCGVADVFIPAGLD